MSCALGLIDLIQFISRAQGPSTLWRYCRQPLLLQGDPALILALCWSALPPRRQNTRLARGQAPRQHPRRRLRR
jgi:hypothetical protein